MTAPENIAPAVSMEEEFIRVGAGTPPQTLAGAISAAVLEGGGKPVKLRAVGAGAVNQAIKAIAIARGYVAPKGIDLSCRPGFASIDSRDGRISAVVLTVISG